MRRREDMAMTGLAHLRRDERGYLTMDGVPHHRWVHVMTHGFGTNACYWCGDEVTWGVGGGLTIDHLNWVRHDNSPDNLVPACNRCNATRQQPNKGKAKLHAKLVQAQRRNAELAAALRESRYAIARLSKLLAPASSQQRHPTTIAATRGQRRDTSVCIELGCGRPVVGMSRCLEHRRAYEADRKRARRHAKVAQ